MNYLLKNFALVSSIFAFCALPSRANLGETLEQCISRYGTPLATSINPGPVAKGEKIVTFRSSKYFITITYFQGVASDETVVKKDK
jgi:hypothetical protein